MAGLPRFFRNRASQADPGLAILSDPDDTIHRDARIEEGKSEIFLLTSPKRSAILCDHFETKCPKRETLRVPQRVLCKCAQEICAGVCKME